MSLVVWLPLNGDLENKGLENITVSNNGAVVNDNGKIGKCYYFNPSGSYITINSDFLKTFEQISFSCWVKINTWNTNWATFLAAKNGTGVSWSNLICALLRDSSNSRLCFTISNGTNYTSTSCRTGDLSTGVWYNFICTYANGYLKLYQNGQLVSSYQTSYVPNFASIQNFWIGRGNSGSYQTDCYLNDIRIYDHALSLKEIKEISKALVLHYPLDNNGLGLINPNLLKNSLTERSLTARNTGASGDNYNYYTISSTGLTIGQTYTFSAIVELEGTQNLKCTVYNYNSSETSTGRPITNTFPADGTTRGEWTFTAVNTGLIIYAGVAGATRGVASTFKKMKLEQGSIATPWCPNTEDAQYTILGYNNTTIQDISGYQNNGTANNITYSTNTPKYLSSACFNGTDGYILTPQGSFSWFDFNQCTIAAWFSPISNPSAYSGSIGIAHNLHAGHKCFAISNYSGKFTVNSANGGYVNFISTSNLPIGEWHHCVATLNGTTVKMYFDGQLIKTATLDWGTTAIASDTRVQIGVDLPGTDEKFNGYYSDARIYMTALSDEDILQLYHTSALADKNNNFYTYQYNQQYNNESSISRTNILKCYQINQNPNYLSTTYKSHNAAAYLAYQFDMLENLQAEQTYTLQLWDVDVSHAGKTQARTGIWIYWGGESLNLFNWAGTSYFTNGHAAYLSKTFTVTSAQATHSNAVNAWFNVYNSVGYVNDTMNMSIGKWKLTKGGQEVLSNKIYYKKDASLHSNNFYEI